MRDLPIKPDQIASEGLVNPPFVSPARDLFGLAEDSQRINAGSSNQIRSNCFRRFGESSFRIASQRFSWACGGFTAHQCGIFQSNQIKLLSKVLVNPPFVFKSTKSERGEVEWFSTNQIKTVLAKHPKSLQMFWWTLLILLIRIWWKYQLQFGRRIHARRIYNPTNQQQKSATVGSHHLPLGHFSYFALTLFSICIGSETHFMMEKPMKPSSRRGKSDNAWISRKRKERRVNIWHGIHKHKSNFSNSIGELLHRDAKQSEISIRNQISATQIKIDFTTHEKSQTTATAATHSLNGWKILSWNRQWDEFNRKRFEPILTKSNPNQHNQRAKITRNVGS